MEPCAFVSLRHRVNLGPAPYSDQKREIFRRALAAVAANGTASRLLTSIFPTVHSHFQALKLDFQRHGQIRWEDPGRAPKRIAIQNLVLAPTERLMEADTPAFLAHKRESRRYNSLGFVASSP